MGDRPERAELRRTWLRGYRASDVEIALARSSLQQERLQLELDAFRQRTQAMQTEIDDLHGRIEGFRSREAELDGALAQLRRQHETLRREAETRQQALIAEAERKAAGLRTEALRELGEVQEQVEELLGLRTRLVRALRSAGEQIDRTLESVGTHETEPPPLPRPAEDLADRLSRLTREDP
jgi:cell division septum initiation protein DivIVA